MRILAIDTSTKQFVIALYDNGALYGLRIEAFRRLSKIITTTIARVLKAADCPIERIDYFGCGVGPGSFTGLRVGMAAIKGLAWAAGKPVVGVSSLSVIASAAPEDARSVIVAVDAKRGLVYCARYTRKKGRLMPGGASRLVTLAELCRMLRAGTVILGDAAGVFKEELRSRAPAAVLLGEDYWYPQPHYLMHGVRAQIEAGKISRASDIEPVYLYPKECQIKITSHQSPY